MHGPIGAKYIRVPIRTHNLEVQLDVPSREGLNVRADISILYRVRREDMPRVLDQIGLDYQAELVLPVFRSAVADVCSRFYAKDMHSGERSTIEHEIRDRMADLLSHRGFEVETVLLKSIKLPPGLYQAVEAKLAAEQEAQRMEFVLVRERLEADRRRIEAEGIRDSQFILADGLSPEILSLRSIEAFQELARSPNAKVIVTDGTLPMLVDPR